jgi:predicted O-linked N-acetylglucosamine transferase (SPINDLY family)
MTPDLATAAGLERAVAFRDAGRNPEAEHELQAWLRGQPSDLEALALLVQVQLNLGKTAAAEATFARLVETAPRSAAAYRAQARILVRKGEARDAVVAARAALAAEPERAENALVLATTLVLAGAAADALMIIDDAIARAPSLAAAHVARAQALAHLGRPAEAAVAIELALDLKPQMPLWALLGSIRLEAGDREGAMTAYRESLATHPADAAVLAALGQLLRAERRYDEARSLFERALTLQPGLSTARLGLATLLLEQNDLAGARAMFEQAFRQTPTLPVYLKTHLLLPAIPDSEGEIEELRAAFAAALDEAAQMEGEIGDQDRATVPGWFYLAYHGSDDRPLVERLDSLFTAKGRGLSGTSPHLAGWKPPATSGRRIRVGFVSQFFYSHTNGRLYAGLVAGLDRSRFEVVIIHLPGAQDDNFRAAMDGAADKAIRLPRDLAAQRACLAAEELDVIFFTDIGMGMSSYWLARSRLAPVQATSWGYPVTSGLASIDYFVSSDLIEPQDAEAAYSERLIRLPRLPSFYELPAGHRLDRAALGLPKTDVLYGCLQSLFKIHPQFDAVLAEIAAADPGARLLFIDSDPILSAALRKRWARFPVLGDRVQFLPRIPVADFLSLTGAMDVLLDPPHFGSGNTLYEAAGVGTPIVTWPGRFARGRIVAGAYAQMGISDAPVATALADYASLAVSLAHDPERRAALGERLRVGAEEQLFRDDQALRGLEAFFEASVAAAGRGEKLASGWRPST